MAVEPRFCWICKKPALPDDCMEDEFGFHAHDSCLAAIGEKEKSIPVLRPIFGPVVHLKHPPKTEN
jgi:hypothetical protein